MEQLSSLTWDEAKRRAALLIVDRYDIDVDLTDLLAGPELKATSTIRFSCTESGADSFVDCAASVVSATLNGRTIPPGSVHDARIALPDLAADNVLVVDTVQRSTDQATAVHRSVDATDGEVYVWTSFEPNDARRVWACFDQPDLKAVFGFTVTAPAGWTVLSNSGAPQVEDRDSHRRWSFADTPPLSTYVPVINAGPFHELRTERDGYSLGLFARQSLAAYLERDADEVFDVTAAGLAWFGEQFAMPFPQRTYDQVFVPDMGGAMENYGCVTWSDAIVFRHPPSPQERSDRAAILLHEMAHMWFGDIVTMRWWDDLWLNEAFAEWACYWAAAGATEYTDSWAGFLASGKLGGYRVDQGPTSHPIRQAAGDVAEATAGFDAITYEKGASVLKQLVAYVGEDRFVAGLRAYFSKHAWGNASLADLMGELADASGRDLTTWTELWLDTAGTDTLTLVPQGDGLELHAEGPSGATAVVRPHRLDIGAYDRRDGALVRRESVPVETTGTVTPVPDLQRPADLLLVNDDDLTFAAVRPDAAGRTQLLEHAGQLPTATARAVAVATCWDLLYNGELSAAEFVGTATSVVSVESVDVVIESFLSLAHEAASLWSTDAERDKLLTLVADTAIALAESPGARRTLALRTLADSAVDDAHFEALRAAAGDDVDLRWRLQTRLAALGRHDEAAVDDLLALDPDPDGWVRALAVGSAQPSTAAKEEAWRAVADERRVPIGSLYEVSGAFWQPGQDAALAPYAERYLELLPRLASAGMIAALATSSAMFPLVGVDAVYVNRVVAATEAGDVIPVVAGRVRERADQLRRMLAARGSPVQSR